MMQMRKKRAVLELGHDAFLDIVANLVGILIILVVVLGSQSTAVIEEIKEHLQEDSVTDRAHYASDEQLAQAIPTSDAGGLRPGGLQSLRRT